TEEELTKVLVIVKKGCVPEWMLGFCGLVAGVLLNKKEEGFATILKVYDSTTEAIHLLRSLMEKYRERQRDLNIAFLDLEKAYASVPCELIWRTLIKKATLRRYLRVIRDMYQGLNNRLEWEIARNEEVEVHIGDQILQSSESFRYLGSMIHKSGRVDDDVAHRIRAAKLEVETIIHKMREGRLRWFGHVKRRPQSTPAVRRVEALLVDGLRRRGKPKLRWEDRVKQDMKDLLLAEDMTLIATRGEIELEF
ncbi:hypothetical protein Tco_1129861, partial [Tanacetum coccineum]